MLKYWNLKINIQELYTILWFFLETFNNLSDKAVKKPLVVYNEVDDLSLEESFPELRMNGLAHVRGKKQRGPILIGSSRIEDPNTKKHGNRKKREKIRRIYTDPAWYLSNYNICYYWTTWLRNSLRIKQLHNSKSENEKRGVETI